MKNKVCKWLLTVLGVVLLIVLGGAAYMLWYALVPQDNDTRAYQQTFNRLYAEYPATRPWCDSLRSVKALRDTFVTMPHGERHHALYIPAKTKTARTALVVHGYTSNAPEVMYLGYMYHHDLDCNVLLPDLHAHGKSEGKVIRMGWKEREDLQEWIALADTLFGDSCRKASIVVHGVSMGAATTMNLSGEHTPASVRCFVEDCGYTSVWDEFGMQLSKDFGLPEFPLLHTTSLLCKLLFGWSFGQAAPLRQVEKCNKPMLFIHGDNDKFVPTEMVYKLYQAKSAPKELYIARGSEHAKSYHDHQKEYTKRVRSFIAKYM